MVDFNLNKQQSFFEISALFFDNGFEVFLTIYIALFKVQIEPSKFIKINELRVKWR